MQLIDAHAHVHFPHFDADRDAVIEIGSISEIEPIWYK